MLGNKRDLLGVFLWAAMALVAVASTNSVALRLVAGVPLVFFLPGYALLRALGLTARSALEWHVLAIGMSVVIVIIGGFVLNGVEFLSPLGWAVWLTFMTAAASGAAAFRSAAGRRLAWPRQAVAGLTARHGATLAVAALVAAAAFTIAVRDEYGYRQFHYTEFWMVPDGPERPGALTIGVKNAETSASAFDIEVLLDGRAIAVWRSLPLDPGETLTEEITLPPASGRARKAEAWLFKSGERDLVYRKVSAAIGGD
jgi:uncharacterized membrane protein